MRLAMVWALVFLVVNLPLTSAQLLENVALPSVSAPDIFANESGVISRDATEFREEDTGESILVQVDDYEPKALVSSIVEDDDVPVFVFLKGATLGSFLGLDLNAEPLFASPEITQVNLRPLDARTNDFVRGAPKYVRPEGKISLENLGHLAVLLKQIPREADVPNSINLSYTAEIYFTGVERLFNLFKTDLVLPEDADESVWRSKGLTEYSFFAKRGFIRASSIDEDSATFVVYSGEDLVWPYTGTPRPIDTFTLRKGETTDDFIRMRAARGLPQYTFRVKLNDVSDSTAKKARLKVTKGATTEEVTAAVGSALYPGSQWTVAKIDSFNISGQVQEEVTLRSPTEEKKVRKKYFSTAGERIIEDPCVALPVLSESSLSSTGTIEETLSNEYEVVLHDQGENLLDLKLNIPYTLAAFDVVPDGNYLRVEPALPDAEDFDFTFLRKPGSSSSLVLEKDEVESISTDAARYEVTLKEVADTGSEDGFALRLYVKVYDKKRKAGAASSEPIVMKIAPKLDLVSLASLKAQLETIASTSEDVVACAAIDAYKKVVLDYAGLTDSEGVPYSSLAAFRIAQLYELVGYPSFAVDYYRDSLSASKGSHLPVALAKVAELEEDEKTDAESPPVRLIDNGDDVRVALSFVARSEDKPTLTVSVENGAARTLSPGDSVFQSPFAAEKSGEFYTYNWRVKKIDSESAQLEKFTVSGGVASSGTQTIELREQELVDGKAVLITEINVKQFAFVSIIPGTGRPLVSRSNFSIHIPIEKRAIPLAVEKIPQKINNTEDTIKKLDAIITKLDKVVSTWKKICLVTFFALTLKNSFLTGGSRNIARNSVMRGVDGKGGWYAYCLKSSGKGKAYGSFDNCIADNIGSINSEMDAAQDAVETVNSEMKDYKNTGWFRDVAKDYKDLDKYGKYMGDNFFSEEDLRDYRFWQLMKESEAYRTMDGSARGEVPLYNFKKEVDEKLTGYEFGNKAAAYNKAVESLNEHYTNFDSLPEEEKRAIFNDVYQGSYLKITETKAVGSPTFVLLSSLRPEILPNLHAKRTAFVSYTPSGEVSVETATVEDYKNALIKLKASAPAGEVSAFENEIKNIDEFYKKTPRSTLESEKGTVYKDNAGKFYVANKASFSTGATSTTYAADAVVEVGDDGSPYCVPVGAGNFVKIVTRHADGSPDKMEEWNVGSDGKMCNGDDVPIRLSSVLERPEHAADLNKYAGIVNTIGKHNPGEVVRLGGRDFAVSGQAGKAAASLNAPTCYDVMDPGDCQLLFGVCDPVMCPPSRFNLGGAWHVDDVVQTGLIGSLVLGLHNFGPNEPIPVCLTGVLAGLRNIKSILEGYVQCLKTAEISGRSVGICDQIRSVYVCELLWNEVMSIFKIKGGLATLLSKFVSGESPGGGEYLTFQSSLDNVGNSFNFFTKHYATNAFASYNSRSMDEFGGVVCKAAIFGKLPDFGGFIDEVSTPEDPPQYTGFVTEMPFSETLGQSRYQVYYHIYAGKNAPVEYTVFLRDEAGNRLDVTDKCRRGSATRLEPGGLADQTLDCVDAKGLTQMCISINGKTDCGFGKVTTEFALDYLSDLIVEDEVGRKIDSEEECAPDLARTSPSLGSIALSGQSGLLSTGIQRVCSVKNPGEGIASSNWKVVGSCGKNELGISLGSCWIDTRSITVNDLERNDRIISTLDENTLREEKARLGITGLLGKKESEAKLKEVDARKKSTCEDYMAAATDYHELSEKSLNPVVGADAQYKYADMIEQLARKCALVDENREYKILLTTLESDLIVLEKDYSGEVLAMLSKVKSAVGIEEESRRLKELYLKKVAEIEDEYKEKLKEAALKAGPSEFYEDKVVERVEVYKSKFEIADVAKVPVPEDFAKEIRACNECDDGLLCSEDECLVSGDCYHVSGFILGGDCFSCSQLEDCKELKTKEMCGRSRCTSKAKKGAGLACSWVEGLDVCATTTPGSSGALPVTGAALTDVENELKAAGCPLQTRTAESFRDDLKVSRTNTYDGRNYLEIMRDIDGIEDNAEMQSIVAGVIGRESSFSNTAGSPGKAYGLGQFIAATPTRVIIPCGEGRCDDNCLDGSKCYVCSPKGCSDFDNRDDPDVSIYGVYTLLLKKDQAMASSCKEEYNRLDAATRLRLMISAYNIGEGVVCRVLKRAPEIKTFLDYANTIRASDITYETGDNVAKARGQKCYVLDAIYYAAVLRNEFGPVVTPAISSPVTTPAATIPPTSTSSATASGTTGSFTFVVISDSNGPYDTVPQGSQVDDAVRRIIEMKPSFVIHNGDMIAGGHSSWAERIQEMWDEYFKVVANPIRSANIPLFPSAGNHDASFKAITLLRAAYFERWSAFDPGLEVDITYPWYYSFDYQNNHFIVLDGSRTTINKEQLDWLADDLKNSAGKYGHIFVFSHIQLKKQCNRPYCSGDLSPNAELVNLFKTYGVTIFFNGHQQVYYKGNYQDINVVSTGALRGPFGLIGTTSDQPASFVVVDVDGSRVDVKALTGPAFTKEFDESIFDELNSAGKIPGYTPYREVK
ncbi:metallophosphoesterase [Candidatus Woesearchaeota archaeon]|nr:metallophosphoesterase [Candidatus Woesearchaeota archaeon]